LPFGGDGANLDIATMAQSTGGMSVDLPSPYMTDWR
jgi:hypothetical protein